MDASSEDGLQLVSALAREVQRLGDEIGLPYIAVSADISSPDPMLGADGRPLAETVFRWVDPKLEYWKDRGFALRSPFVFATRYSAEPFYFSQGRFGAWRPAPQLEAIAAEPHATEFGVGAAIIAPAHLPGGAIGAVVWATPEPIDVRGVYDERAPVLQAVTLKLLGAYHDAIGAAPLGDVRLTRREIQCLKWAAAGKTDAEIAKIVEISTPTVRFHLKNAAAKLRVNGRSQTVHRAAILGYVGLARPAQATRPAA